MIKYFIAFSYSSPTCSGYSNVEITSKRPICSMKDINELAGLIKDLFPEIEMDQVVIINWQRFEEEGVITNVKSTSTVNPMDYDTFCNKYIFARTKAGDYTDPEELTNAYAVYCVNPAGHWLHKE